MIENYYNYARTVIECYNFNLRYDLLRSYANVDQEKRVHLVVRLHKRQTFKCPSTFRIELLDNIQPHTLIYISFLEPEINVL